MKKTLLFLTVLSSLFFQAQPQLYPSYKINLISMITPNQVDASVDNRRYSGCWGWYQQNKHKEYAISGASNGTYFMDISSPATPTVCDFVPGGRTGCTWRELKTYSHYCYVISDDPAPNKFQIIDMQYLPDSVHVVYSDTTYFERAHTLWIDGNKMYVGGLTYALPPGSGAQPMAVFSLANPEAPVLLRRLEQDISSNVVNYVHDMYVRNDTVYASCANQGLYLFKFNSSPRDTFIQLGDYTGYPFAGYNHSSSLTQNGKYLVFCDEVPAGLPIHLVNVENFSNVQPVQMSHPYVGTTPHNPYIVGNNHAVISCYQDGLMIYDISQPTVGFPVAGYFDTYPQGGDNTGGYGGQDYRGNWGAYPYLPSGLIIATDMQNGLFILDATQAYNNPVGLKSNAGENINLMFYPNPASDKLIVNYNSHDAVTLSLKDMLGRTVYEKKFSSAINEYVDVRNFENGTYLISVTENGHSKNKPLIINH